MKRWECYRCSYVFEGDNTPEECPNCHYSLTFWMEKAETQVVTVRNFVKTDFLTIDVDGTVLDAAQAMRGRGLGNILVTVKGEVTGIVTERDVLNRVAADNLAASTVTVRKIMTSPLITVTAETALPEAVRLMAQHKIRTLVVTDGGKPIGLLNMRSIVGDQFKVARGIDE